MTDLDVIERVARLLDGYVNGPVNRRAVGPRKPAWRAQVKGPNAAAWMMTMYPLLGKRRRAQVTRALTEWRGMGYVRISPAVERWIVEAWNAGGMRKLGLARRFTVSRSTVYNVLQRSNDVLKETPRRNISPMEIAWLAGLIEGEGNIGVNGRSFTIRVKMTDHDVIVRAPHSRPRSADAGDMKFRQLH